MHPVLVPRRPQKDNLCKAALGQDRGHSSSVVPPDGPPLKILPLMNSSLAQKASFEWTLARAPRLSYHHQESVACSGHHTPDPPTHQKQLTWKTSWLVAVADTRAPSRSSLRTSVKARIACRSQVIVQLDS
jgi:ABC-type nickel/cobalt efflux system permease component RcnA